MARVVGIDLGTTYTVVSIFENGHSVVIPNAEGGHLTPSVVAFLKDGKRLVGQLAKRQAVANPERTVFSIKRYMGKQALRDWDERGGYVEGVGGAGKHTSFDQDEQRHELSDSCLITQIKRYMGSEYRVKIEDREYTPQEISAMILRKVRADAESYLGEPIEKAVITVPAYFNDSQRQATKEAGIIAGLDVMRIINEPTAASLAYGLDREEGVHTVLVWDLGGGTFDVSILEIGEGTWDVKAVSGNTWLGGDDWDERVWQYVADEFQKEHGVDLRKNPVTLQMLKEAAEKAKIELTELEATTIRMPLFDVVHSPKYLETTLTREKFDELTSDLVQKIVGPTRQALADARLRPSHIDRVILVGGATRMPAVQELCRRVLDKEPYRDIDPDEVVGVGAGIQAGVLTGQVRDVTLLDVTPLSLGVETMGGIFTKVIERNTSIPCSKSKGFTTAKDDQTVVDIHVLQGERNLVMYNASLDWFSLRDIPPAPRGDPQIEVTFQIDVDGIVHVSAEDLQTENMQRIRISSKFTGLPEEEIERMVEEAQIHAEEDKQQYEEITINIAADSMIAAAEHLIDEAGGEIDISFIEEVERGILAIKAALAEGDSQEVELRTEALKKPAARLDREIKRTKREEAKKR